MAPPPAGLLARLLRLLAHPRAPAAIALLAVLCALPTVTAGFYSDDFLQMAILERTVPAVRHVSVLDLYRFVPTNRAEAAEMVLRGPVPWFADPALKLHFLRPVSCAFLVAQHALWGRWAAGYHLGSLLLYVALVLAAGAFYRVLTAEKAPDGAVTASLAMLCFALTGSHNQPVAWIAGCHLLVAALPAVLALAAHVRHVRDGWRPGAVLAPLGLLVSLLASEAGLGGLLYWLAFDALGPAPAHRATPRARLAASLPALALGALYAIGYRALGYGAAGSDGYLDPAADPGGFALAALTRVPALLGEAFTGFPADLYAFLPHAPFVAAGLAGTLGMAVLARVVLPAIPAGERATLRWLLPGAFAAIVLVCGGFVGGRLLVFPSLGIAYLIAVLLHRSVAVALHRRALTAARAVLVVLHLVLGALAFTSGALFIGGMSRSIIQAYQGLEVEGPGPYRVVVVAASDPFVALYSPLVGALYRPVDAYSWQVLSTAKYDHRVTRTGPNRLRLDVLGGHMAEGIFDHILRTKKLPFHEGDRVALLGGDVTVLAVDRGLPTAIEAAFDVSVDDPAIQMVVWRGGRLARFRPPPVGESVDIRWEPGPSGMF